MVLTFAKLVGSNSCCEPRIEASMRSFCLRPASPQAAGLTVSSAERGPLGSVIVPNQRQIPQLQT